ncbi:DUF4351 domain-containing protein [Skermanella sp. TT6]|uniref:DUF4351 domain-containing protein n=1 Tax=Skermanella cutis TaxID=2775420 RepID=A0ABX7AYY5_9PROT|nr:DUF4351 domain-containing protein [Skermanella sp. TT6]QQP87312.1 DUF4351 domain-containing protein [Skermanella sp. TT6]
MANDYDATVKDLVWAGAPALLGMLAGAPVRCFLSAEFSSVRRRRPDMVARLMNGSIFHLELQAGPDARLDWRMLEYYGPISELNDGAPVTQLVLHLGERGRDKPASIAHPNLNFAYHVRYIGDLDSRPLLDSPAPEDAVLAILCGNDDIRMRVRNILARIVRLDRRARDDAAAKLLILAQLRRAVPVVKEELRSMAVQINVDEHPYLREIAAMGEAKGKAGSLLRQIERRLGQVPPEMLDRVRGGSAEELDRWMDAVCDASTLDAAELESILSPSQH